MTTILAKLKEKGYRITVARQAVLRVLSSRPLGVKEIDEVLGKKNVEINVVTIYRVLELLASLGLVNKTQFEGKEAKYEFAYPDNHHHHLVCEKCGSSEDICLDEKKLIQQVERQSDFKLVRHNLEFFGICKKCQ
jgi:Fur family ferric uptake transcriptional regulator